MKHLVINHYIDSKLTTTTIEIECGNLQLQGKLVVIEDKQKVVFVCKVADFVSLAVL